MPLLLILAACQSGPEGPDIPGDRSDTRAYEGIAPDETLRFSGTEPFWAGEIAGSRMVWKTPEKPDGETFTVSRFNGRGGFSYSGTMGDAAFTMALTPGTCSDGMSERVYPFVVTLQVGEEVRHGCAWSDRHPAKLRASP